MWLVAIVLQGADLAPPGPAALPRVMFPPVLFLLASSRPSGPCSLSPRGLYTCTFLYWKLLPPQTLC